MKNAVNAMMARNWATGRAPAWLPTLDCLAGDERSLHLLELPLSAYVSGALWLLLGSGGLLCCQPCALRSEPAPLLGALRPLPLPDRVAVGFRALRLCQGFGESNSFHANGKRPVFLVVQGFQKRQIKSFRVE